MNKPKVIFDREMNTKDKIELLSEVLSVRKYLLAALLDVSMCTLISWEYGDEYLAYRLNLLYEIVDTAKRRGVPDYQLLNMLNEPFHNIEGNETLLGWIVDSGSMCYERKFDVVETMIMSTGFITQYEEY